MSCTSIGKPSPFMSWIQLFLTYFSFHILWIMSSAEVVLGLQRKIWFVLNSNLLRYLCNVYRFWNPGPHMRKRKTCELVDEHSQPRKKFWEMLRTAVNFTQKLWVQHNVVSQKGYRITQKIIKVLSLHKYYSHSGKTEKYSFGKWQLSKKI